MTDLRQAAQQALEALENSVDLVRHEYITDWRHGLPTRKAQLDGMKEGLDAHEATITALRTALEQQAEPVAVERWLWIFEEKNGDRYTHKNLFYTADEAAESARICGVKAIKKIESSKVTQQAEPVAWDKPSASFNAWWDSYRHDPANPFAEGSAAYWAWAGRKSAQRQWVGLTDEEIHRTTVLLGFNPEWKTEIGMAHAIVRNLEAKLKERNT